MLPRRALIFLAFAWVLVMLYPDPRCCCAGARHGAAQIEPEAVATLAARLPTTHAPSRPTCWTSRCRTPTTGSRRACPVLPDRPRPCGAGADDCEQGRGARRHPHREGHPERAAPEPRPHLVDYPGKQANAIEYAGVQFAGRRTRILLPWPKNFQLGPGDLRPAGRILLDAGAGVARAAARRRPLADCPLERARPSARRRAPRGDGLLPAAPQSRRRRRSASRPGPSGPAPARRSHHPPAARLVPEAAPRRLPPSVGARRGALARALRIAARVRYALACPFTPSKEAP